MEESAEDEKPTITHLEVRFCLTSRGSNIVCHRGLQTAEGKKGRGGSVSADQKDSSLLAALGGRMSRTRVGVLGE